MFYFVQQYCKEVIEKKRRGFFPFLLRLLLHPFSWLFHLGITARNWAFDHGWLRRYYPPIPAVISVGNIVAGGTGKTPTVEMIAREFVPEYSLAILSRGYRSPAEKQDESTILSKGMGPKGMRQDSGADLCGDEPYLLSVRLPEALVIVGKNRRESSKLAARNGAQIIILDDGMQHRSLARDFEVVVMHGEDLFGGGYFLPRGFLREGKNSLERSDLIIINHIHDRDHFCSLKKEIIPYTAAPVIGTQMIVKQMKSLTGALFNCSAMQGKRAGVFCGIANPDSFKNSLKNLPQITSPSSLPT